MESLKLSELKKDDSIPANLQVRKGGLPPPERQRRDCHFSFQATETVALQSARSPRNKKALKVTVLRGVASGTLAFQSWPYFSDVTDQNRITRRRSATDEQFFAIGCPTPSVRSWYSEVR